MGSNRGADRSISFIHIGMVSPQSSVAIFMFDIFDMLEDGLWVSPPYPPIFDEIGGATCVPPELPPLVPAPPLVLPFPPLVPLPTFWASAGTTNIPIANTKMGVLEQKAFRDGR